jgi:hypothetical protein
MQRWTMPLFVAMLAAMAPAFAADLPGPAYPAPVYRKAPPPYGHGVIVRQEADVLFTPSDGSIPYVHFPPLTPLLPGRATLPGNYGSVHSYEYDGPYYGGPYTSYWNRLPYACGVYGYC